MSCSCSGKEPPTTHTQARNSKPMTPMQGRHESRRACGKKGLGGRGNGMRKGNGGSKWLNFKPKKKINLFFFLPVIMYEIEPPSCKVVFHSTSLFWNRHGSEGMNSRINVFFLDFLLGVSKQVFFSFFLFYFSPCMSLNHAVLWKESSLSRGGKQENVKGKSRPNKWVRAWGILFLSYRRLRG